MRISDWSSDVCSSDLSADVDRRADAARLHRRTAALVHLDRGDALGRAVGEIERARRRRAAAVADQRGRHLTAVHRHPLELGTEAANRDPRTFTVRTGDRNAVAALDEKSIVSGEVMGVRGVRGWMRIYKNKKKT